MRPTCLRCLRTIADCYCGRIRAFESAVKFAILQHPKEFRNRMGTARMASLCVRNSVLVAGERDDRERAAEAIILGSQRAAVLYPGPGSCDLREIEPGPLTLFVIDATWAMAKKMVRQSPILSALPRVAFRPEKPSGYLFRRQPKPECVSTIEAIHEVIEELDRSGKSPVQPRGAHANLLEVFEWMARRQSSYTSPGGQ